MASVRRLFALFGLLMLARGLPAQRAGRSTLTSDSSLAQTTENLVKRRGSGVPYTRNDALARQQQVRSTLLSLIGPLPEPTPLHPVTLGATTLPGMRIEKVLFESQPNFQVTALLYLPDVTLVKPFPAVIIPSSDGPQGKSADFALAAAFVRNGIAVLSYDRIGQGERLQYTGLGASDQQAKASLQPILIGESIARYLIWDAMRAVDYLQTRSEIDPAKIGAFGCSGAGADVALLAALDTRIAATADACYLTSFSALLHANIGPQDAEQSLPGLLRRNLDYADYVEAVAPRPYAIVATQSDYLPFAGTRDTEREARTFYSLFDSLMPTINDAILGEDDARDAKVAFAISAAQNLAFITAPGTHGELKPMLPRILKFFSDSLQAEAIAPVYDEESGVEQPPPGALQVTSTGQVATFNVNAATVYSLNLAHAQTLAVPHPDSISYLRGEINHAAGTELSELGSIAPDHIAVASDGANLPSDGFLSRAGDPARATDQALPAAHSQANRAAYRAWHLTLSRRDPGSRLDTQSEADLYVPQTIPQPGAEPGLALILAGDDTGFSSSQLDKLLRRGQIVLMLYPRPVLPTSEGLAAILGSSFELSLRYMLVGKTILGRRIGDILGGVDYLSLLKTPHKAGIEVYADGHLALVMIHAAVFDSQLSPRIAHLYLSNLPPSYAQMLASPNPGDIAQDLLPGVLRRYDIPDLLQAIYGR